MLCVAIYCGYRIVRFLPWPGYNPSLDTVEQLLASGVIVTLGAVQITLAFRRPPLSRAVVLLALQVLLAYGPYVVLGGRWDLPGALVVAAVLLTVTGWLAWTLAALAVLCEVAVRIAVDPGLTGPDGPIRVAYVTVVAIANGLLVFGVSHLSELVRDLYATRAASVALEVARERMNIARRLHDAVGARVVSVIATCRRGDREVGHTGERARAVVADAQQALAQVRAVADDYRNRSLAGEVAAACTILAAAGVEAVVGAVPDRLPEPIDAVLGSILRRTVVTALRGTPPRSCRIELSGSAWMRVSFAGGAPGAPALDGIVEEVQRLDGRLRVEPGPGTTGEVEVWIPVQSQRPGRTRSPRPAVAGPWLAWGIMAMLEVALLVTTVARASGGLDVFGHISGLRLACVIALIVPLSLLQLHHVRPRSGHAPPGWRWTLTLQIVLLGAIAAIGGRTIPSLAYAGPVAGVVLFHVRRPWSWAVAGGLVLAPTLVDLHRSGIGILDDPQTAALWTVLAVPWALLAMVGVSALCRLPLAAEQLVAARQELTRLAVLRERLRIARDTHDLLGFQLSAIALKAGLAGRLAGTDPGAALVQLAEAGQVAEQALNSLRSITAEPTGLSFAAEVESGRSMLSAADVRVVVELHATPETSVESPLAIILREALTNVVRHSRATTCEIKTCAVPGGVRLTVTNDGVPAGTPDVVPGNGLTNLRARAREAGGGLSVHRQGDRFVLVAEIGPARPDVELSGAAVAVAG